MYQVLVIDDDKLARKGLISLIPWEKIRNGGRRRCGERSVSTAVY